MVVGSGYFAEGARNRKYAEGPSDHLVAQHTLRIDLEVLRPFRTNGRSEMAIRHLAHAAPVRSLLSLEDIVHDMTKNVCLVQGRTAALVQLGCNERCGGYHNMPGMADRTRSVV